MKALQKLFKSFIYAFAGLFYCVKTCRNFRIHIVAAITVLWLSRFYDLSSQELAMLLILIGLVMAMECINTSIEQLCNEVSPEYSVNIKRAKDAAAAAVLCVAIVAAAVAVVLFFKIDIFKDIVVYFSTPIRLMILIVCAALAVLFIFYEDIFKHEKE